MSKKKSKPALMSQMTVIGQTDDGCSIIGIGKIAYAEIYEDECVEPLLKAIHTHDDLIYKMRLLIEYSEQTLKLLSKKQAVIVKEFIETSKALVKRAEKF